MTKTTSSPTTKSMPIGTSESLNASTPANICKDAGPWNQPELIGSPEFVLESLRETQHMINALEAKKKRHKAELIKLHADGLLQPFVDESDPQKFNGDGVTVALCQGRTKRTYNAAVQMELDAKQAEIDRIKYLADRTGNYTDKVGPSHWRVSLAKDEIL